MHHNAKASNAEIVRVRRMHPILARRRDVRYARNPKGMLDTGVHVYCQTEFTVRAVREANLRDRGVHQNGQASGVVPPVRRRV